MAIQCDIPIVNFLVESVDLPEYLTYWPKLEKIDDVKKYIRVLKQTPQKISLEKGIFTEYTKNQNYVEDFYRNLNQIL